MDRLAITTFQQDITPHIALAREHQVGIEIQVYGYKPNLLDGDWQPLVAQHKALLRGFAGEIALHGAFYDMNSASEDNRIVAITRERYLLNLQIASELGAEHVVFHANYLHVIRHPNYLLYWTKRQVDFWSKMAIEAQRLGVFIALENMWEPNPDIIANVLDQVDSAHLGACLDVGHAHLYAEDSPFINWVERLQDRLIHCHINNNLGVLHCIRGNPESAYSFLSIALSGRERTGDRKGYAETSHNLAMALMDMERFTESERFMDKALTVSRELREASLTANILVSRAELMLKMKLYEIAGSCAKEAMTHLKHLGDPLGLVDAMRIAGTAAGYLNKVDTAREMLEHIQEAGQEEIIEAVCLKAREYCQDVSRCEVAVYLVDSKAKIITSL